MKVRGIWRVFNKVSGWVKIRFEISVFYNYNINILLYKEGFMMKVVSLAVLAVMFVLFSCSLSPSPSNDGSIYVSTSGNDYNDGLSPSKPVRTLVKAVEICKYYG